MFIWKKISSSVAEKSGPLHMSPVDRATSVSEISGLPQFLRSRLATLFFTKISMCSYEKAGWPSYRDLGFCDRDLGNGAGNFFPYEHSSPDTGTDRDETILTEHGL